MIILCALKNTNKLSGAVAGEMVAELTSSLAYHFIFYFIFCFTFSFIMNSTPIYQYAKPTSTSLKPLESIEPILTPGFELSPSFIQLIQDQSFSGEGDENPYSHLREFLQICRCLGITGMLDNTLR
jgi:hypothetical protein